MLHELYEKAENWLLKSALLIKARATPSKYGFSYSDEILPAIAEHLGIQTKPLGDQISAYRFLADTWPDLDLKKVSCSYFSVLALRKLFKQSRERAEEVRDQVLLGNLSKRKAMELVNSEIAKLQKPTNHKNPMTEAISRGQVFERKVLSFVSANPSFFWDINDAVVEIAKRHPNLPMIPDATISSPIAPNEQVFIEIKRPTKAYLRTDILKSLGLLNLMAPFGTTIWLITPATLKNQIIQMKEFATNLQIENLHFAIFYENHDENFCEKI